MSHFGIPSKKIRGKTWDLTSSVIKIIRMVNIMKTKVFFKKRGGRSQKNRNIL